MNPVAKTFLIGCGVLGFLALCGVVVVGVWLFTGPEGGVKLGNEVDTYALEYLEEHEVLEPGEEILAYYDVTIAMDGTEAAILTDQRVMYHKAGKTTSILLDDIADVRHRYESLIGDIFEIQSTSGRTMKIEIAPFNQGETFKNVLMATWQDAQ